MRTKLALLMEPDKSMSKENQQRSLLRGSKLLDGADALESWGCNLTRYGLVLVLLWIGGMILFGIGAAAVPMSYEFKMLNAPAE